MQENANTRPILLVEDNPDNRQLAMWILEDAQYNALEADSGENGLEILEKNDCALVLMDISLPGMDGKDVIGIIRQSPRYGNVPIIALTAHAIESEKKKIMDSGADDIITKPIDEDALLAKMEELLGK